MPAPEEFSFGSPTLLQELDDSLKVKLPVDVPLPSDSEDDGNHHREITELEKKGDYCAAAKLYVQAVQHYSDAIVLQEKTKSRPDLIAAIYKKLANCYLAVPHSKYAIQCFKGVVRFYEAAIYKFNLSNQEKMQYITEIVLALRQLVDLYHANDPKKLKKSIKHLSKLFDYYKTYIPNSNDTEKLKKTLGMIEFYFEFATKYQLLGKYQRAIGFASTGLGLLNDKLVSHIPKKQQRELRNRGGDIIDICETLELPACLSVTPMSIERSLSNQENSNTQKSSNTQESSFPLLNTVATLKNKPRSPLAACSVFSHNLNGFTLEGDNSLDASQKYTPLSSTTP